MSEFLHLFDYAYVGRALTASVMVGLMCGVLGCFIVLRNMSLIGDALSHAILPGVVVGFLIAGAQTFAFFTGSVVAGMIAAILITYLQRHAKTKNDAAIGIVFTSMFALGVMGISALTRKEGVHLDLKDFLFGNVLGIGPQDLILTGFMLFFVLGSVILFYKSLFISTFQPIIAGTLGVPAGAIHYFLMLLLSLAVVASLQSVGVILVVAMLIIPASTAYLLTNRLPWMLFWSGLIGSISAIGGMIWAIIWETTPGPAMTLTGSFIYLITVFFAPNRGLLIRYWKKRNRQIDHQVEDLLKAVYKVQFGGIDHEFNPWDESMFAASKHTWHRMVQKGWKVANKPNLSDAGIAKAEELIRAHRLWESYLHRLGVTIDELHPMAESFEHHLHADFLRELDRDLGHPAFDPHGSEIPR
jgi:ABC-type Mn2+/Zn2+ transport system permease subunit